MDFEQLEKNICDTIKEGQIKIGYREAPVRLYYPADSITELLKIEKGLREDKLLSVLEEFKTYSRERLGNIHITCKQRRFCFWIPGYGTAYVHKNYKDNPFLKLFLQVITAPQCSKEKIQAVFQQFSDRITTMNSSELGFVIYFEDKIPDEYVYCVKFDEFGATYHRFTRNDFMTLQ